MTRTPRVMVKGSDDTARIINVRRNSRNYVARHPCRGTELPALPHAVYSAQVIVPSACYMHYAILRCSVAS